MVLLSDKQSGMLLSDKQSDAYGRKPDSLWSKLESLTPNRRQSSIDSFFSGYQQKYVDRADGKRKAFIRIYTGTLYHQELDRRTRLFIKIAYSVIFLSAVGLFIGAICIPAASNNNGWVMLAVLFSLVFYARLLFALLAYLPAKQDFREYEYLRGVIAIPNASKRGAFFTIAPIMAALVMILLKPGAFSVLELIRMAMLVVAGAQVLIIGMLESRIRYTAKSSQYN